MRSTDSLSRSSLKEIRIELTQNQLPRAAIERIVLVQIACKSSKNAAKTQIRKRQQRRNVRIVHEIRATKPVHLVRKHFSLERVIQHRCSSKTPSKSTVILHRVVDFLRQFHRFCRQFGVSHHVLQNLRAVAKIDKEHDVSGDEERELRGIVRGTECASNLSNKHEKKPNKSRIARRPALSVH